MAETETETEKREFYALPACDERITVGHSVLVQPYGEPIYFGRVTRICYARLTKSTDVEVRRYYLPEETVGGKHTFYGNKELLLTNHVDTLKHPDEVISRVIFVHNLLDYTRLETVGRDDFFCRFEYDTEQGWLSPAIVSLFCKCKMPFNPDMFTLKCQACKERYHPACINMTLDEAKPLADNFTCCDCLTPDNQGSASTASATVDPLMVGHKRARR